MSTFCRTHSSPNLSVGRQSQLDKYAYEEEEDDDEFYVIGDRVYVDKHRAGSVAYFGEVEFAAGDWVGVVLDQPTGQHDGRVHGREYFQCAPFHGTFVRPHRVSRMFDSALGYSTMASNTSSRSITPLPTFQRLNAGGLRSKSPGSIGSYYYDDDYRQGRPPSVQSLAQRLKSLNESQLNHPTNQSSSSSPNYYDKPSGGILKATTAAGYTKQPATSPTTRNQSPIGAKAMELSRRLQETRSSAPTRDQGVVFNFRPKREQLSNNNNNNNGDDDNTLSPSLYLDGGRRSVNLSSEPARKGDQVTVRTERGEMTGILRFLGETNFATGEWAGVELDHPYGKNDGSVLGHRYFHCPKNYGLFVPATRVKKCQHDNRASNSTRISESPVFGKMRSTLFSPPPPPPTATPIAPQRVSSYGRILGHSQDSLVANRDLDEVYSSTPSSQAYSTSDSRCDTTNGSSPTYTTKYKYSFDSDVTKPSLTDKSTADLNTYKNASRKYDNMFNWFEDRHRAKFDEADIEAQLRRSLRRPTSTKTAAFNRNISHSEQSRPKAVKYTFTSSKYDGNPIACRTLVYD